MLLLLLIGGAGQARRMGRRRARAGVGVCVRGTGDRGEEVCFKAYAHLKTDGQGGGSGEGSGHVQIGRNVL